MSPLGKNPQFLSNQADIQGTLPSHELIILSKFHNDWQEIVDFLATVKFRASIFFLHQSLCTYISCHVLHIRLSHSVI